MLGNGFLKNKKTIQGLQKALLAGVGITSSRELITKAFTGLYDDVQKITRKLVKELEQQGQIKTKEAREIVKSLQKKSETEKAKIFKRLQKDFKLLINAAKDIVLTPISLIRKVQKVQTKPLPRKARKKPPRRSKK